MTPKKLQRAEGGGRELAMENIALRSMLGGGCDANDEGPHKPTYDGAGKSFCFACGEMLNKAGKSTPWLSEERLNRRIAALKARAG